MVLGLSGRPRRRASASPPPSRPPAAPSLPSSSVPVLHPPAPPKRSPSFSRSARSFDFERAHTRWSALASQGRSGLVLANDVSEGEGRPADSMDSISLIDPGGRAGPMVSAGESGSIPACWIRNSCGPTKPDTMGGGGVRSPASSPALEARPSCIGTTTPTAPMQIPSNVTSPQSPMPARQASSDFSSSPGGAQRSGMRWDYAELTALKQKFNMLDEEGKGFLSRSQFLNLFSSIIDDPMADGNEHSSLFNFAISLFYSSGESLNLKEFVAGMTILSKGSEEERLRYLFMMYDSTGCGFLKAAEIIQVFRVMSSYARSHDFKASESMEGQSLTFLRQGNPQSLEDLALKTLAEHDMDGDGKIGFAEFSKWCAKDPVVKTWMDMLAVGAARGVARLREKREQALLARELDSLGFADNEFWRESFALDPASQGSSSVLPPTLSHDLFHPPGSAKSDDDSSDSDSPREPLLPPSPRPPQSRHNRSFTQTAIDAFEIDFQDIVFEDQVGSGSFAIVWRCKWLDSPVAVKVFKLGPRLVLNEDGTATAADPNSHAMYQEDGESFDPGFDSMVSPGGDDDDDESEDRGDQMANHRDRFLQEVSLLKQIRHPNLLLYMGACVDPRFPLCIVSELIDGGSLFDCLHGSNKVELNLHQKLKLTQDIARGMLYLHGRDPVVLHRDLKSANILVSLQKDGSFKGTIIDFGLSKLNSTQASLVPGHARGLTGSLVTMAPEVMNEQKYQTRSDVYSFGIICWEIFCGRIPFGKTTQVAQLLMKVAVRGERPKFATADKVPVAVQNLIRGCWDQDINKRPDFLFIVKVLNGIRKDLEL